MADKKISALTSASTPLAGTEVFPIVQGGATVKTTIDDVNKGRSINLVTSTDNGNNSDYSQVVVKIGNSAYPCYIKAYRYGGSYINGLDFYYTDASSGSSVNGLRLGATGNITLPVGNLVQGTAAKGVNFTANTPAAGMTSQLLNWYEEGTWTPNQGGGLTVVGAFISTGHYTRVGRTVVIRGTVTGATSVAVTAAGIITTNLPFTVGTAGHGNATNAAINAFAAVICTTTNVTSAGAITATGTITFSATYFV